MSTTTDTRVDTRPDDRPRPYPRRAPRRGAAVPTTQGLRLHLQGGSGNGQDAGAAIILRKPLVSLAKRQSRPTRRERERTRQDTIAYARVTAIINGSLRVGPTTLIGALAANIALRVAGVHSLDIDIVTYLIAIIAISCTVGAFMAKGTLRS